MKNVLMLSVLAFGIFAFSSCATLKNDGTSQESGSNGPVILQGSGMKVTLPNPERFHLKTGSIGLDSKYIYLISKPDEEYYISIMLTDRGAGRPPWNIKMFFDGYDEGLPDLQPEKVRRLQLRRGDFVDVYHRKGPYWGDIDVAIVEIEGGSLTFELSARDFTWKGRMSNEKYRPIFDRFIESVDFR